MCALLGVLPLFVAACDAPAQRADVTKPGRTGVTKPGRTEAPTPIPAKTEPNRWGVVQGPRTAPRTGIVDLWASGSVDVWAVGRHGCERSKTALDDEEPCPDILRWDGRQWRPQRPPRAGGTIWAVSGRSRSDVWVAGSDKFAYIAHWDGRSWAWRAPWGTAVPESAPDYRSLRAVAVSGKTAWFAGEVNTRTGQLGVKPVLVGWDGRKVSIWQQPDEGRFVDIVSSASGQVWAAGSIVGRYENGIEYDRPLIVRWTGTTWARSPIPDIWGELSAIWQGDRRDAWAVGYRPTDAGRDDPVVLRWDGRSWRPVAVPVEHADLYGVTGDRAGRVWISGFDPNYPRQVLFLSYNGHTWTRSYTPVGRKLDLESAPPGFSEDETVKAVRVFSVPSSSTLWSVGSVGREEQTDWFILRRRD